MRITKDITRDFPKLYRWAMALLCLGILALVSLAITVLYVSRHLIFTR